MDQPVIELTDIRKSYGDQIVLGGLSMHVQKGEVFGFLGPNGAGKTTTLRILLDIIRPDSGTRRIFGRQSALRSGDRIGYLPEERGLYRNMTPEGVIAYFAMLKGIGRAKARARARELLDRYGLGDVARRKIKTFSKGMAQKVQVLATVAHEPDLVILDEPFSGLDPVNQQVLEELIGELRRAGCTVVFSTHVMQHAERLCDRIQLIGGGHDLFEGTVDQARSLIPGLLKIRTKDDVEALREISGVISIRTTGQPVGDDPVRDYEIEIKGDVPVHQIMRSCFRHDIYLEYFSLAEPSLHDVFVKLVGDDAMTARTV